MPNVLDYEPNPIPLRETLKFDINDDDNNSEGGYKPKEFISAAFKVLIIGNSRVGKSSLIKRAVKNEYDEKISPTMGVDTTFYNHTLVNNGIIKLML
jgi:GTPase SAR1 family protein